MLLDQETYKGLNEAREHGQVEASATAFGPENGLRFDCAANSSAEELAKAVVAHWRAHNVRIRFSALDSQAWRSQGMSLLTLRDQPDFTKLESLKEAWVVVPMEVDLSPGQVPQRFYERRRHTTWLFEQSGDRLGGSPDHLIVPADLTAVMEKLALSESSGGIRPDVEQLGRLAAAAMLPRQRLAS